MTEAFEQVDQDLRAWAGARGIEVRQQRFNAEKAGEFNG